MDRPHNPAPPPLAGPAYASSADVVGIERIAFEHGFVVVWARLADAWTVGPRAWC
jgi:hypothetical protein